MLRQLSQRPLLVRRTQPYTFQCQSQLLSSSRIRPTPMVLRSQSQPLIAHQLSPLPSPVPLSSIATQALPFAPELGTYLVAEDLVLELPSSPQPHQALLSCLPFLCQPPPSSVLLILLDQQEAAVVMTEAMEAAMEEMEVETEMVILAVETEMVALAVAVLAVAVLAVLAVAVLAVAVLETEPTLSQLHLRLAAHSTLQSAHLLPLQASHPTPALLLLTQLALVSLFSDWLLPLPCKEMVPGAFIRTLHSVWESTLSTLSSCYHTSCSSHCRLHELSMPLAPCYSLILRL